MFSYLSVFGWLFSVVSRVFRVVPSVTSWSLFFSVVSQFSQVISFLLPLKVMILLGASSTPNYFPRFMLSFERDDLAMLLGSVSIVLYIFHLILESFVSQLVSKGSSVLIARSNKLELLDRQDEVAHTFYRSLILLLSGVLLSFITMLFFAFFKTGLFVCISAYFFVSLFVLDAVCASFVKVKEKVHLNFPKVIVALGAFGFFISFVYLGFEYLKGYENKLLLSILALLLCRQLFSRLGASIKVLERLYLSRERVRALFFHNAPLMVKKRQDDVSFWQVIHPDFCRDWVESCLLEIGVSAFTSLEIEYIDAGVRRQIILHVLVSGNNARPQSYLFKVFDKSSSILASHEAALLTHDLGGGAPRLLMKSQRQGFHALLLTGLERNYFPLPKKHLRVCRAWLVLHFLSWPIPQSLESAFVRSRSTLPLRLNDAFWSRCQVSAAWCDAAAKECVAWFAEEPDRLSKVLDKLPLCLYNPDVFENRVFSNADDYLITYWGGWSLEPAGCGWPLEIDMQQLDQALVAAIKVSDQFASVSSLHLRLSALSYAFESKCDKGCYRDAFSLLHEMRKIITLID